MNDRTSILGLLRRWKTGAARYVVGAFAVAYLSAGVAPCLAVASRAAVDPAGTARNVEVPSHEANAVHGRGGFDAHAHHGHETHAGTVPAHDEVTDDGRSAHCPHCLGDGGAANAPDGDHASCSALDDFTDVAVPQGKVLPALAPSLGPAAFTLPPPLASPVGPVPSRAVRVPLVPINVRHCVFLI
jgi:hypothetical protein